MSSNRQFDIVVLGAGPAGLVSALAAAKSARTALVLNRLPATDDPVRIDAIPARTLALLVELGVNPRDLGAATLNDGGWASWEAPTPSWRHGAKTAHIERPRLEQALLSAVRRTGVITLIADGTQPRWIKEFVGNGWRSRVLIDASGRSSVTARSRTRPDRPWASRFFWSERRGVSASPEFRIAALSSGYAYRLGSADRIGIGIAGRGPWLNRTPEQIEQVLRKEGAGWLCDGMPPLSSLECGASGACSVQWTNAGQATVVGDAALARDSLSSQGLAASLSDALYAVAAITSGNSDAIEDRHAANLLAHLTHLHESLTRCRFVQSPLWGTYRTFVADKLQNQPGGEQPVLRDGRLLAAPRDRTVCAD